MKIIDVHAHTSNHRLWGLHVETATIDDLTRLAGQFNIQKIVLMATYFPFKKSGLHNHELYRRIKGNDLFAMFGSLDVTTNFWKGFYELVLMALQKKIAGIKLYPGYQEFDCSDSKIFPIFYLARVMQIPVMFHTGELHHCCPRDERKKGKFRCGDTCMIEKLGHLSRPEAILPAIKAFPHVNFILSHLGNPYFNEQRQIMTNHQNVYTDISGQFVSGLPEEDNQAYRQTIRNKLRQFLNIAYAGDRIMFGTDFPIQSYQASMDIIDSLDLAPGLKEKILHKNAKRLLKI